MGQKLFTGIALILIIILAGLIIIRNIIFPSNDIGGGVYANTYKIENSLEYKINLT